MTRILVVDDDRRMVKTLVDILEYKGYEVRGESASLRALDLIREQPFDCILTDIKMPELNGLDFFKQISKIRPEASVVFMTAYAMDDIVQEARKAGVLATLTKPLDINLLICFFSALDRERSIVIVDDDPQFCRTLGAVLRTHGFSVIERYESSCLEETLAPEDQVVLLDMNLKQENGLDVLKRIRQRHPFIPVVLVTGYREDMAAAIDSALHLKAFACLYKPFPIEELLQVLAKVHQYQLSRLLTESPAKRR